MPLPGTTSADGGAEANTGTTGTETGPGGNTNVGSGAPARTDGGAQGTGPNGAAMTTTSEGGTVEPGSSSGGPLPTWAQPLLGTFAKRVLMFNYDTIASEVARSAEISLLTIAADEQGTLWATTKLCSLTADWPQALAGSGPLITIKTPSVIPPIKQRIALGEAPTFSAEATARQVGFDPNRQSVCNGKPAGASVMRFPDQVWLTAGTCKCAENPAIPPTLSTDCRVTDPDGDHDPGIRLVNTGLAAGEFGMTIDSAFSMVVGKVHADGRHEFQETNMGAPACFSDIPSWCSTGAPSPCGAPVIQIVPMQTSPTCENAIASLATALGAASVSPSGKCPP
jgi:hypothetical protein